MHSLLGTFTALLVDQHCEVNLPEGIVTSVTRIGCYDGIQPSPKKTEEVAYWAKIDPRYSATRAWCLPGMVVGIFPTGAGPAACTALVVCVVTSQPFVSTEDTIAIAVFGKTPVLLDCDVLNRFYDGKVNRALFWTEEGRVDFADDHNIILDTAKFIGDAFYDADRLYKSEELNVCIRSVDVLVACGSVSVTNKSVISQTASRSEQNKIDYHRSGEVDSSEGPISVLLLYSNIRYVYVMILMTLVVSLVLYTPYLRFYSGPGKALIGTFQVESMDRSVDSDSHHTNTIYNTPGTIETISPVTKMETTDVVSSSTHQTKLVSASI